MWSHTDTKYERNANDEISLVISGPTTFIHSNFYAAEYT